MELPTWLVVLLGAAFALAALIGTRAARRGGVRIVPSGPETSEGLGKIERIKRYREQHRVGLKEAKQAVEALERGEQLAAPPPGAAANEVEALLQAGNVIGAIKAYREQTGVGLKEAKEAIDRMRAGR